MTFLQRLATAIIENSNVGLKDTAIILPTQRATKLLQQVLAEKINKAFFSPTFFTIDKFIEKLSPFKKLSSTELLLHLFDLYHTTPGNEEKSFSSFLSWGSVFIQDINEIDMQLANAHDIFTNLADIKEIDNAFLNNQLSKNAQSYIDFYKSLYDLYSSFTKNLKQDGVGYSGMIYKEVANNIADLASSLPYKRYIFAGFNMFSPAELKITKYFSTEFHAEFYFDLDEFYYNQQLKETYMVEQMQTSFSELNIPPDKISWLGHQYKDIKKEVSIVGVPKHLSQVLYATELLEKMTEEELNHTAVVLADEALFAPFIHTYGRTHANYTMGYPLKATMAYNLLNTLITTLKDHERFQQNQPQAKSNYYHKDLLAFFRNPIIQEVCDLDAAPQKVGDVINGMIERNRIFFDYEDLPILSWLHFPRACSDGLVYFSELLNFFDFIMQMLPEDRQDFYSLTYLYDGIINAQPNFEYFKNSNTPLDINSFEYLLTEEMKSVSIPLSGNPDSGLQVMGLLESRILDFDNVILLSVNEGVLPKGKSQNSLILHNIKQYYKLPTYHYRDAVAAYHFFRLLQHAQSIHLIYDNDSSDSLSEKSRFINQLIFEIKRQNLDIQYHQHTISTKLPTPSHDEIKIEKDEKIIQKLKEYRYSPTSLNTFIQCPLKFYLSKIARINQPECINETVESSVIGTIIHAILEHLYDELKEQPNNYANIIKKYRDNLRDKITEQFIIEKFQEKDLGNGKLYLAFEVIQKYLLPYFDLAEKEFGNGYNDTIGTEIELRATIDVDGIPIQLGGKSDRVDYREKCVTILDYKTGKVDAKYLKLKNFNEEAVEALFTDSKYDKLFQLLSYAYIYNNDKGENSVRKTPEYRCGIISFQELLKKAEKTILYAQLPNEEINKEILDQFEEKLKILFANILDKDQAFTQAQNKDNCKYCDYKFLCGQQNRASY